MRILLVGAGGVGTALARIAARRPFAELVIADYDLGRAQRAAAARDGYQAVHLDARDEQATVGLLAQHRCDVLMNATDPRFMMPLFRAALQAGTHYLDMAMSLSYCTCSAWTRPTRCRSAPRAGRRVTWWPRACRIRPAWATG